MIQIRAKTNTQITSLNLSGKELSQIPKEVFTCTNLKKLNLSNNNLLEIPKEINQLTKLEVLDLSNNQLRHIQAGLFYLKRLKTLNISHNQLKKLPIQIKRLSCLTSLMVQNNNLEEIDYKILPPKLEKLNISNNNLKDITWIDKLIDLKSLWVNNNPIENFSIESIIKLQSLRLRKVFAYSTSELSNNVNSEYLLISLIKGNVLKDSQLKNYTFNKENMDEVALKSINSNPKKPHVFISYSHSNSDWLNRIIKNLNVLSNLNLEFVFWEDTKIKTGDHWLQEIEQSIENADIAILLVSTDFLSSQFVMKKEVPKLLKNAGTKGTKIMPIILSPCLFTETEIGVFQAANDPNKTLEECSYPEQERILTGLMKEIKTIIKP